MIKSMTGYGRARQTLNKRDITVEGRSVNNRYLDCTVKMPRMYAFAEDAVKQTVQKSVSRGKVDVFVTVDASAADVAKVTVNRELAAQYAAALGELAEVCGPTAYKVTPETLARFPDVLTVTKADEDLETVSADLCAVLEEALAAYHAMRAVEGQKLAEDIANRLDAIEAYTAQVEERLRDCRKPIKVAVMGCAVNGPGEAREADIGVAGGDGCGLLFKKGEIIRKVPEDQILDELMREIEKL
mgnify:CR=1 FL=1